MKNVREFIWPLIGLLAVIVSGWLLYRELRGMSLDDVWDSLTAVPSHRYALAGLSTLVAYAALAWYDRIALLHLGVHHISWLFVSVTSFTTYALSHNIGASVFSGAVVRYRAYTSKGLGAPQIAVLVALCSFTFGLGTILLGGIVLVADPTLLHRLEELLPAMLTNPATARIVGLLLLAFVALYVAGSVLHLPPLVIRKAKLEYPRPAIMVRQLIAAPLELLGAAGIIYFVLPAHLEPSFIIVLAVFLASFSAALVSHAPGGLGVFELVFLTAMPDIPKADVLAALIIFRLFYLMIPFGLSLVVVLMFERARLAQAWRGRMVPADGSVPPPPLSSSDQ
jgi:glycosyltransferase 2 family protein